MDDGGATTSGGPAGCAPHEEEKEKASHSMLNRAYHRAYRGAKRRSRLERGVEHLSSLLDELDASLDVWQAASSASNGSPNSAGAVNTLEHVSLTLQIVREMGAFSACTPEGPLRAGSGVAAFSACTPELEHGPLRAGSGVAAFSACTPELEHSGATDGGAGGADDNGGAGAAPVQSRSSPSDRESDRAAAAAALQGPEAELQPRCRPWLACGRRENVVMDSDSDEEEGNQAGGGGGGGRPNPVMACVGGRWRARRDTDADRDLGAAWDECMDDELRGAWDEVYDEYSNGRRSPTEPPSSHMRAGAGGPRVALRRKRSVRKNRKSASGDGGDDEGQLETEMDEMVSQMRVEIEMLRTQARRRRPWGARAVARGGAAARGAGRVAPPTPLSSCTSPSAGLGREREACGAVHLPHAASMC